MTLHNHESDKETTQANRAAEHIAIRFAKPFDHKTISIAYDNGTNAILSYDSFPDSATLSDDRLVTHIRGVGLYDGFHRTVRERSDPYPVRVPYVVDERVWNARTGVVVPRPKWIRVGRRDTQCCYNM